MVWGVGSEVGRDVRSPPFLPLHLFSKLGARPSHPVPPARIAHPLPTVPRPPLIPPPLQLRTPLDRPKASRNIYIYIYADAMHPPNPFPSVPARSLLRVIDISTTFSSSSEIHIFSATFVCGIPLTNSFNFAVLGRPKPEGPYKILEINAMLHPSRPLS